MLKRIRRARRRLFPKFPGTSAELAQSDIFKSWWYYTVELMPGMTAQGQYPDSFPMLPRMLLRNCDVRGANCLDLGSMEGLVPALLARRGAAAVTASDFEPHCEDKMAAIRHFYDVKFGFQRIGLMYELTRKFRSAGNASFDLVNLSGVLYHVFSPLLVLLGARPLLRKGGLMVVSTNVVLDQRALMEFNDGGRLQEETNTFWYVSVNALDYILRYLKLAPIDCLYLPHRDLRSKVRYLTDVDSGYLSVVCRATDDVLPTSADSWMLKSARESWEYAGLSDWAFAAQQPSSNIRYEGGLDQPLIRSDIPAIDLARAIPFRTVHSAERSMDAHILKLADRS